jgi:hypothetical protein
MSAAVHRPIWPILAVLLIALWLRIALPVSSVAVRGDLSQFRSPDTYTYVQPAAEWLATGKFAVNGDPEIIRTPGYAALLIPGILLNNIELITVMLQILLSGATVYGIYRIGLLIFRRPAPALLGAALYALEPLSILYSSKLLTETLSTALLVWALYFLCAYLKSTRWRDIVLAALGVSAATYVRPISYYLPIVIASLLGIWAIIQRPIGLRRPMQIGVFLLVCFGLIGGWQIRNRISSGYSGFTAINAINAYSYQAAAVLANQQGKSYVDVQNELGYQNDAVYLQVHPEQRSWSEAAKYQYQWEEGLRIVFSALPTYARIHAQGMLRTLLEPSAVEYLKMYNLYPALGGLLGQIVDQGLLNTLRNLYHDNPLVFWSTLVLAVPLLLYYCLALIGLSTDRMYRRAPVILLIASSAYLLFASGGPQGLARFRHPLMPVVCLLAGHGLWQVIVRLRGLRLSSRAQA